MDVKIAIAMPLVESIKMQTVISMLGMVSSAKHAIDFVFIKDSQVHESRRRAVLEAQSIGASHIFFFDSDMKIEPDAIERLLSYQKEIVGVNYHAKSLPLRSVIKFQDETGKVVQAEVPQKSLFRCFAIGTGAVLIDMKVFDKLERPWFFYDDPDKMIMTEDIWFCRQAQRAGIEVWCTSEIECLHIGDYEY